MTETGGPKPWYSKDIWLILVLLLFAGITLWNSRTILFPDRFVDKIEYSSFEVRFRYPSEAGLWEVGLDDENIFVFDGSIRPSMEKGMVGYGWGGQEASVTWAAVEPEPTLEEVLEIHYRSVYVNGERRDREVTITKGEVETGKTNGHTTALQFHELELTMPDSSELLYGKGYVAGWYCPDTGRLYIARASALLYCTFFHR